MEKRIHEYARRALIVIGLVAGVWLLWKVRLAFLLAFAGLLLAVFLSGLTARLQERTPLSRVVSLVVVIFALIAFIIGAFAIIGPQVSQQFSQLAQQLPQAGNNLMDYLRQTQIGQFLLQLKPSGSGGGGLLSGITNYVMIVAGAVTNAVVVLFVGIYFAIDPAMYRRGLLRLAPKPRRPRLEEVFDEAGSKLWRWLMGRLIAMIFVGIATTIGLMIIGVPLALALGFLAFLLDFVLFVGPIAASIPALLLALSQGPTTMLYTAGLYLAIQQIEGNIVTPLVQQEQVQISPALVLLATVVMGLLFGVIGIIIAVPLTVLILVLVEMLYVEDVLEDRVDSVE